MSFPNALVTTHQLFTEETHIAKTTFFLLFTLRDNQKNDLHGLFGIGFKQQKRLCVNWFDMNTITGKTAFHPYKVVDQGRNNLQLQPPSGHKFLIALLWFIPLAMIIVGIVLFVVEKEALFLLVFGGIGLLEAIVFAFIRIPASLSVDSIGFTLETLSLKGKRETYFLWHEIDYIRYQAVRGKNSTSLAYHAIPKNGKKVNFLNFHNYHAKKQHISEINSVIKEISNKEIRED
jgi:hypothetical protein